MAWAGELWRSSPAPMPAAAPHASAEATRNLRSGMCAFISFLLGLEGSGGCKKFKIVRCCREAASAQEVTRSEEHTSELQSLMRISYAVFCLKKKTTTKR